MRLIATWSPTKPVQLPTRDHRGVEYERESGDRTTTATKAIQKLRGRLVSVTETKLEGLRNTANLTLGEFRVTIDVRVLCTECDSRYGVAELLSSGGCDCPETSDAKADSEPGE